MVLMHSQECQGKTLILALRSVKKGMPFLGLRTMQGPWRGEESPPPHPPRPPLSHPPVSQLPQSWREKMTASRLAGCPEVEDSDDLEAFPGLF